MKWFKLYQQQKDAYMNASTIMKQFVIYIIQTGAILQNKYFYVWYFKYISMTILLY